MMKKIIISLIFFIMVICITNIVTATTISFSPSNPKVGDDVTVTVSISNVDEASIIANVSGAVSGTVNLKANNETGESAKYSKSGTFRCTKEGTMYVSISSDSSAKLNGQSVDVGASASVKIAASGQNGTSSDNTTSSNSSSNSTASKNANLSNLGIKPNDFSGFKANKTEYNVKVPNSVKSVEVYATVQEKEAKYSVSGPYNNLKAGKNTIVVTVTAPDGETKKTYTMYIEREAGDDEEEDIDVIEENEVSTVGLNEKNDKNENDTIVDNKEEKELEKVAGTTQNTMNILGKDIETKWVILGAVVLVGAVAAIVVIVCIIIKRRREDMYMFDTSNEGYTEAEYYLRKSENNEPINENIDKNDDSSNAYDDKDNDNKDNDIMDTDNSAYNNEKNNINSDNNNEINIENNYANDYDYVDDGNRDEYYITNDSYYSEENDEEKEIEMLFRTRRKSKGKHF